MRFLLTVPFALLLVVLCVLLQFTKVFVQTSVKTAVPDDKAPESSNFDEPTQMKDFCVFPYMNFKVAGSRGLASFLLVLYPVLDVFFKQKNYVLLVAGAVPQAPRHGR